MVLEADQVFAVLKGDQGFQNNGHLSPESIKRIDAIMQQERDVSALAQQVNQMLHGHYKLRLSRENVQHALTGRPGYEHIIQSYNDATNQVAVTEVKPHY